MTDPTPDEVRAAMNSVVDLLYEREFRQLVATAEMPTTESYDPSAAHPALADRADVVRHYIREGRHRVLLPRPAPLRWFADPDPRMDLFPPEPTVLHVRRRWAPAPYVGDPFAYGWFVAVSDAGQWVSDDARIIRPLGPIPAANGPRWIGWSGR